MGEPEPTASGTCRCGTQRWAITGKCSCSPKPVFESAWDRDEREKREKHRAMLSIADSLAVIASALEARR